MSSASADAIAALLAEHALPASYGQIVRTIHEPVADRLAAARARMGRPIVVGVCGTQASGKSTLSVFIKALLEARGLKAGILAIDDLYLSKPARQALAQRVHPLFITRGPPGTHDVPLGQSLLDALTGVTPPNGQRMPRFDKLADTLAPQSEWPPLEAPVDVVLFEGWCVGARPQPDAALADPVNALEREHDPQGAWRGTINAHLKTDYAALFARIDLLLMLKAPSFDAVFDWRSLQERKLGEKLAAQGGLGAHRRLMTADDLRHFLAHYQRLTEWILSEMPGRTDILIRLATDHSVEGLSFSGRA